MRVLVIAPQPFFLERGTPIAVRMLVTTLCEFGHSVDLLVYHEGQDLQLPGLRLIRAGRPPGVRHVPIGISWQKLACDVFLIARMVGLMLRNRYDVVHAVEEAIFPTVALSLFSKRRVVYDMDSWLSEQMTNRWRVLRPLRRFLVRIERWTVRRAALVLPVCVDLAEKIQPWIGERRIIVLPDVPVGDTQPADTEDTLRRIAGPDTVIGLYVGNLEDYQGIDLLLEGLARLPQDTRFRMIVIGGNDEDIALFREMANRIGIGALVHFIGPRPIGQLNSFLAQADVLVSPRILGGNTPMKIYSYMQSGKVILATNIRSHTQVLDATCAVLVAPDPGAVAKGIERLLLGEADRTSLGREARRRAESEYSVAAYRVRLQRAYDLVERG